MDLRYTETALPGLRLENLARNLRHADKRECITVTGHPPWEFLPGAVDSAEMVRFFCHPETGKAIGIFGVHKVPDMANFGLIWLMATREIRQHKILFHRSSLAWISHLHETWPTLGNIVDSRNELHISWLKACGFTIFTHSPHIIEGTPFYEFVKVKE